MSFGIDKKNPTEINCKYIDHARDKSPTTKDHLYINI